jgi:mRNA interferase RelE/StbE
MKVEIEQQVLDFVGSLAPEPRRLIRETLRRLEKEKGDIRALEGELEGFYRLRAGRYRIIFYYRRERRTRQIRCVYAAHRTLIYEVFAQEFHDLLEG